MHISDNGERHASLRGHALGSEDSIARGKIPANRVIPTGTTP